MNYLQELKRKKFKKMQILSAFVLERSVQSINTCQERIRHKRILAHREALYR